MEINFPFAAHNKLNPLLKEKQKKSLTHDHRDPASAGTQGNGKCFDGKQMIAFLITKR